MIVAFDLDGTLADITHRLPLIQLPKKDWAAFYRACGSDAPILHGIAVAHALWRAGHAIEVWSGRSDEVRDLTQAWLEKWVGCHVFGQVRMRPAGDYRPDDELKEGWLKRLSDDKRPRLALDDRRRVVDMWRRNGVPCYQVAPGDF